MYVYNEAGHDLNVKAKQKCARIIELKRGMTLGSSNGKQIVLSFSMAAIALG